MNFDNIEMAGIDYMEGIERFGGIPALYEKYVCKFLNDDTFRKLEQCMQNEEYKKAFEEAHTLKGEVGNLSFIAFYNNLCDLVEALRNENDISLAKKVFKESLNIYDILVKIIREEFQHGEMV